MKQRHTLKPTGYQAGNTLMVVLLFCTALLIVSSAFFHSMSNTRRLNQRNEQLMQAREGAEAALGYATAELNRVATSLAAISDNPLSGYVLTTADKDYLAGSATKSNVVSSSLAIKAGKLSSTKTDMTLYDNDPAYAGDQSAGLTMAVRSGYIFAKASSLDPVLGKTSTSYISGVVQVREQTWLNYGMFYNMDMEFYPGKPMDVKGAVHTNADMYLAAAGSTSLVNFYKKVTSAGEIYHGLKYNVSGFNTDSTAKGFSVPSPVPAGYPFSSVEGAGKVYITKDGTSLVEMTAAMDCLGTKSQPSLNTSTWIDHQKITWKNYVMDSSLSVEKFTPPGLPLYVPEDLSTTGVTELRNHGYAMIEPQLPATDNKRYYGQKSSEVEDLKFSALAGWTIVVEDRDLAADSTATDFYNSTATNTLDASKNGYSIPWKLVWYEGATLSGSPVSKDNLPKRDGTTKLPVTSAIDPFGRNDEVDFVYDSTITVTMRRNLKALLRDAIVVVPYRDSGATTTTFGTGTVSVGINKYPSTAVDFIPGTGTTRYNQPAGAYPKLNTADTATYYPISVGNGTGVYPGSNRYPDSKGTTSSANAGAPNASLNVYSGHYDRRQGYSQSTSTNNALKGATHVVYIDLQKLNWIINTPELWKHPTTGNAIYDFTQSFTNLVFVDLPSAAKNSTRHGLTDSDKVCPAASPTTTKPGYSVILDKGSRLPRLPYNESVRTPGFTLACNGPLYVKGNFNSDGLSGTGDSIYPDSSQWYSSAYPNAYEMPAMLAADAVTFLTENYNISLSNKGKTSATANVTKPETGGNGNLTRKQYDGYSGNSTSTTANFQEISTAIICGLVPTIPYLYTQSPYTNPQKVYSGSVNNLPRFLEANGAITVRYRGSMAALFESEVSNSPFLEGPHSFWFAPPTRDWGYHQYLASGKYPPGTPVLRTTRLIAVTDITESQYNAGPSQPP